MKMLDAAARSVFLEYVLELEGMARGVQVEYETLLTWNCRGDLPLSDDAIPEYAKHSPEGCTTHLYPATKSSVAVIAYNTDGPPELDGHCCWLSVRQENGSRFPLSIIPECCRVTRFPYIPMDWCRQSKISGLMTSNPEFSIGVV